MTYSQYAYLIHSGLVLLGSSIANVAIAKNIEVPPIYSEEFLMAQTSYIQRGCSAATEGVSSFSIINVVPPTPTDILSRDRVLVDLGPEVEGSDLFLDSFVYEPIYEFSDLTVESQVIAKDANAQAIPQILDLALHSVEQSFSQCSRYLLDPLYFERIEDF